MDLDLAIKKIANYLNCDIDEFKKYTEEDNIGGYHPIQQFQRWPIGSIFEVEGKLLYGIVRAVKPETMLEVGTRYGCSTAHILAAMDKNEKGKLITVDIVGNSLAKNIHPRLESIISDAVLYCKNMNYSLDMLFEDGLHTYDFTRDVVKYAFPHIKNGGVIAVHDVAHFLVGADVSLGFRQVVGDFEQVLVNPSDCGLGYYKKK